ENLKKIRRIAAPADFMELLQLWIFAPPWYEKELASLEEGQRMAAANEDPQSQQGFEGQLDACIQHDSVDRLPLIKVPTLITIGAMDIFTPPSFSDVLHKGIRGSRLEIFPTGGHVHHWEDLERFNRLTAQFLINQGD
ncbi:MAG: hypothetical protein OEQ53_21620, partial [Saprospiraceae bacterium]|nr:hypothetical protein [Saprospiraceae bacterium]